MVIAYHQVPCLLVSLLCLEEIVVSDKPGSYCTSFKRYFPFVCYFWCEQILSFSNYLSIYGITNLTTFCSRVRFFFFNSTNLYTKLVGLGENGSSQWNSLQVISYNITSISQITWTELAASNIWTSPLFIAKLKVPPQLDITLIPIS